MKGFKPTGNGPKSGHFFSSKKGFSGSTGRRQEVSTYSRAVPKRAPKKFAVGGPVGATVARAAALAGPGPVPMGKSPIRREQPTGKAPGMIARPPRPAPVAPPGPVPVVAPTRTTGFGAFGRKPIIGR